MIQIESSQNLEISRGRVSFNFTDRNSSINIILGGKRYRLNSSKAKVIIEKTNNEDKIFVEEGTLNVKAEDEIEEIKLIKDEALKIESKALQVNYQPIRILKPTTNIQYTKERRAKVSFNIQAPSEHKYRLHIANKDDMSDTFTRKKILDSRDVNLLPGHYYYQIISSNGEVKSEIKEIEIIRQVLAPKIIKPLSGFKEYTYLDESMVQFEFYGSSPSNKFLIEILDASGNILKQKVIDKKLYNWKTDFNGTLGWRVRAAGDFLEGVYSKISSFEIIREDVSKQKEQVIELLKPDQRVTFNWSGQKDKKSHFIISKDPKFEKIIYSKKTYENSLKYVFGKAGTFYWRSITIDENGRELINPPVKVEIRPTPPPLKPRKLPELEIEIKSSKNFLKKLFELIIPSAHAASVKEAQLKRLKLKKLKSMKLKFLKIAL